MSIFLPLSRTNTEDEATAELSLAQWRVLRRQVPLMYALLLTNTVILAATHFSFAPDYLTLYFPIILIVMCAMRIRMWRSRREIDITIERARADIRGLVLLGPPIAFAFAGWSLALFPYGDAFQQAHIAFYMSTVSITCMFCLLSVRKAAVVIGACVAVPFVLFFTLTGQPTLIASAVTMTFVFSGMTIILFNNYEDFAGHVKARVETAAKQAETQELLEENHRLAQSDSLTGIPNRRSFQHELGLALERAKVTGGSVAIARINLDNFKTVNEVFSQITGDRILTEVAQRLDLARPPTSILARLDSDNFALILTDNTGASALDRLGKHLCAVIAAPYHMPLGTVEISASIGFAASSAEDTPDTLYDHADYAVWLAKRDRPGGSLVFSAIDAHDLRQFRRMEHLLHTSDLDNEIYILMQPQFDVSIGLTTGFEVLARWRSPVLGEISPADFIPMAERTGHIGQITQIVLRKAIEVSARLPRGIRLSVNLSANDICSPTAIDEIVAQVEAAPRNARVDFEITETAIMRDLDQAKEALSRLLSLGSRISLDDFGTGHSSLTHVQRLPLHRIKIDRSFVAEVTTDATSRAIVKTMIDLCRNLGMSCVFEGIETEAQFETLVGLGGTVMQGYLFGRPMSIEMALAHADETGVASAVPFYRYDAAS
jgi:diguanylate cyclase (GGDEF)-like protein